MLDKPAPIIKPIPFDPDALIAKEGVYENMPIDRYHGDCCVDPSTSKSGLVKIVTQSPAHFWAACPWNLDVKPEEPNTALDFGKAVHMLLLGERGFAQRYVLKAFPTFQTNKAKAWRDAQMKAGRSIISQEQIDQILAMRDSLAAHPLIQQGALNGRVEMSMFTRLDSGIWLKARPDVIPLDSGFYADLKTCASVEYDALQRDIWKFGYHIQAAVVRMCAMALGLPFEEFALIFVEKTAPYVVRPLVLKSEALEVGQKQALLGLKILAKCIERSEWPGPQGFDVDIEHASIPEWATKRVENQQAILERMVA